MGIQDFYKAVELLCGNIVAVHHFSEFAGYRIAIDISIFLYKTIRSAGPVRWVDSFIVFLCLIKKSGIKAVCIHDGPNPPPEKKAEQERRRAEVEKTVAKLKRARKIYQQIKDEYIPTSAPVEGDVEVDVRKILGRKRGKSIDVVNYNDPHDVAAALKEAIEKYENQTMPITNLHKNTAKELIELMGIAQYQADGEAETLCAYLCVRGQVDAVLSEDTDCCVYGTPILLSKIDLSKGTVSVIQMKDILKYSGLNYEEFRDLCVTLGSDYNDRVKGYPPDGRKRKKPVSIGLKGAVAMITEYRRLEECERYIIDIDKLNYRRCRQLFTTPAYLDFAVVPYSKPIQETKLAEFLKRVKAKTSLKYIMETWKPVPLIFGQTEVEKQDAAELDEIELGDENVLDEDGEEPIPDIPPEPSESLEERLDRAWNMEEWTFIPEKTSAEEMTLEYVDCVITECVYLKEEADPSDYAGRYRLNGTDVSLCHLCFENGEYGGEDVGQAIRDTYG